MMNFVFKMMKDYYITYNRPNVSLVDLRRWMH